jgi:hypothetical protein
MSLEEYSGCGRQTTALLIVDNLGHAPPTGATADYIWSFFESHRLAYLP